MREVLGGTLAGIAIIGAIVSWFTLVINMFRTVANRKEGVPLFPNWLEGPFNILFRPSQLTDRGLVARRKCFLGFAGFLLSMLIVFAVGYVANDF